MKKNQQKNELSKEQALFSEQKIRNFNRKLHTSIAASLLAGVFGFCALAFRTQIPLILRGVFLLLVIFLLGLPLYLLLSARKNFFKD